MQEAYQLLDQILGLSEEARGLSAMQMAVRAIIVFLIAIAFVRLGNKRFMGRHSGLDVVLGIVFGSVMSRAITGSSPFIPTIIAGGVLVAVHWAITSIAFYVRGFGDIVKGKTRTLVTNGEPDIKEMRMSRITRRDLEEAMRLQQVEDLSCVKKATLERDGEITFIVANKNRRQVASGE